jgi:hypothetical protein
MSEEFRIHLSHRPNLEHSECLVNEIGGQFTPPSHHQ